MFCVCVSPQMIPPRGCAYICMVHRQDAYRARQKLSTGSVKIGSKVIKVHITFYNLIDAILILPVVSSNPISHCPPGVKRFSFPGTQIHSEMTLKRIFP